MKKETFYQECRQAAINRGNVGSSLTQGVREPVEINVCRFLRYRERETELKTGIILWIRIEIEKNRLREFRGYDNIFVKKIKYCFDWVYKWGESD